jgi:hypothetical protein
MDVVMAGNHSQIIKHSDIRARQTEMLSCRIHRTNNSSVRLRLLVQKIEGTPRPLVAQVVEKFRGRQIHTRLVGSAIDQGGAMGEPLLGSSECARNVVSH